jgi:sulfatase maturation enzyme AslB (radical SAM superfamily)
MSIDGIGKVNDYIRYPSQWSKIEKNLKMLDQAEGNYKLWWASTIQVYNMVHLPEMMDWIIDQNFNRVNKAKLGREIMTPHPLSRPHQLSIKIFPPESKRAIKDIFDEAIKKNRERVLNHPLYKNENEKVRIAYRYERVLNNYTNIMMSEDLSHLKERFWDHTRRLDEIHGTSFREVCPTTYELLS